VPDKSAQEKTEPATPRRKQEAREEGKVARSQETSSLAILLFGAIAMYFFIPGSFRHLAGLARHLYSNSTAIHFTAENFTTFFISMLGHFAIAAAPIIASVGLIAFAITYMQVGPLLSAKAIQPKLDKLNLVKGLGNLFSTKSLFQLFRDMFKLAAIGLVGYLAIKLEFEKVIPLADAEVQSILSFIGTAAFRVVVKICLVMIIIAILDFAYQKYDYAKSLRMSKQEIREEMKRYEGSPEIKGRIRRTQRELAAARMMHDVTKADVVVTNPTQIAVALKYDSETMAAPTVVAKGQRIMAQRIKDIANENDVPIVENKPLARALFKAVEIGMTIPSNLYKAVAEVLAYVYRLKGKV
jgi:flagellar biosynthetic protein FlhB